MTGFDFEAAQYPCFELDGELCPVRCNAAAEKLAVAPTALQALLGEAERAQLCAGQPVQLPWHLRADKLTMLTILPAGESYMAVVTPMEQENDGYAHSLEKMMVDMQGLFAALPALQYFLSDDGDGLRSLEYVMRQGYRVLRELKNRSWCVQLAAGVPPKLQTVDLNELLEALCQAVNTILPWKAVRYEALPQTVCVMADRSLLEMIVTHLIHNSIRYAPQESEVVVTLQKLRSRAVLHVADSGTGIRAETAGRVFEAYFSRDPYGDTEETPGSGLGLYLVQQGLRVLGGEYAMESEFGHGTQVSVSLPLAEQEQPEVHTVLTDYLMDRISWVYLQFCPLGGRIHL